MAIGLNEGQSNVLFKQIKFKFGSISPEIESKIKNASKHELDNWVIKLLTANTIKEIFD